MNICVISGPANVGKTKTIHLNWASRIKGEIVDFYEKLLGKVVRILKPYFAIDNAYNENINSFFAKYVCGVLFNIFNQRGNLLWKGSF